MKKIMILMVISLIVLVGCVQEPNLGEECGKISPDERDACCERVMKDLYYSTPACVGKWMWNQDKIGCEWKCITSMPPISSFEECVEEGYPIMESYPEKCSDGTRTFVRELRDDEKVKIEPKKPRILTEEECEENFGKIITVTETSCQGDYRILGTMESDSLKACCIYDHADYFPIQDVLEKNKENQQEFCDEYYYPCESHDDCIAIDNSSRILCKPNNYDFHYAGCVKNKCQVY